MAGKTIYIKNGVVVGRQVSLGDAAKTDVSKLNTQTSNQLSSRAVAIKQASTYSKWFSKGTRFSSSQGHLEKWAKPLGVKGGSNPNYNWHKAEYQTSRGTIAKTSSKDLWGTKVNQSAKGGGDACLLVGTKQWVMQLKVSMQALRTQSENFRVVVGKRALKIFQNSINKQQFYSQDGGAWAPLSPTTLKKRAKRGTGSHKLREYGDLLKSIKFKNTNSISSKIYTDVVPANAGHHKKHSICYAGYHNEGVGTYGKAWRGHTPRAYIQRQFIGHSTHLDPLRDNFMRKIMKLYLFDSVFLIKKV